MVYWKCHQPNIPCAACENRPFSSGVFVVACFISYGYSITQIFAFVKPFYANICISPYLLVFACFLRVMLDISYKERGAFMYDRILALCQEKNISITALCQKVTGSSGNLSTWKKGYMRSDYLLACAEILGVSVDYLLGHKNTPIEPLALKASKGEWIKLLETMSDENLIKLRDYALLLLLSQGQAGQGDQGSQK